MRELWGRSPLGQDNFTRITLADFERWPSLRAIPPVERWVEHVDWFGSRTIPSRSEDFSSEVPLITYWVSQVLGKRVSEQLQSSQGARDLLLVVDAAGKPKRDRLREIAKLGSLILSTTSAKRLTVQHLNTETARKVEVNRSSLVEWATLNGDLNQLGRFFEVDGVNPQGGESSEAPFQRQRPLVDVLADRGRVEKHLPAGAELYLGLMNGSRYNLAVVEATLDAST